MKDVLDYEDRMALKRVVASLRKELQEVSADRDRWMNLCLKGVASSERALLELALGPGHQPSSE